MFKLALLQMHIEGGNKKRNLSHAEVMITEAVKNAADIVLLPEAINLGWAHPSAKFEADSIPAGETFTMLSDVAVQNKIYVCSGLIEKSGDKVFNSAVLISPKGDLILDHRKINELEIGHEFYSQGNKLNVCHCDLGSIGLMICSDAFAEQKVLSQALCYMGADIILSPSCWAIPEDYDNTKEPCGKIWFNHYNSVVKKYSVWIAGVSNVGKINEGPWKGLNCIGNSLVLNPKGMIEIEGPFGVNAETILYTNIHPVERPATGCEWQSYWDNI